MSYAEYRVTPDNINKTDQFRAQVRVNKLLWAVLYTAYSDWSQSEASQLRDACAAPIEQMVIDKAADLFADERYRFFQRTWINENVHPNLRTAAFDLITKLFGNVLEAGISGYGRNHPGWRTLDWQKAKSRICELHLWTCADCHSTTQMLAVHHLWYDLSKEPWDYPDDALLPLCEFCHSKRHGWNPKL